MAEFKWIQMSLFLTVVLQFTAAAETLPVSVRAGGDVTLSCENVIDDQDNCDGTTWIFNGPRSTAAVELINLGQIDKNAKAKSDRLSVTANCSLVIKKVTVEDVGRYFCRQYKSNVKQGEDSEVHLSVVTMDQREDAGEVTLNCSVWTRGRCRHTVKWLFKGQHVDKDHSDLRTSQGSCYASVYFLTSYFISTSSSNSLTCEVTAGHKVQLFPFTLRPSGEKPGEETTTTTTTETTTTTTENSIKAGTTTTASDINDASTELQDSLPLYIAVAVGLAALLIIVVAVIGWKRTKGNKTRAKHNVGLTSNPAAAPGTGLDTADPEDGVSYASISYSRKTNSKGRVLGKDDEDDAVTYTTVRASSSSAGASADPSNFYATVNKPNK